MRKQIKDIKEGLYLLATDTENCYESKTTLCSYYGKAYLSYYVTYIMNGELWHEKQEPKRETIILAQFECWDNGDPSKEICVYELNDGKAFCLNDEAEVLGFDNYELIPNTEYKAYKDTLKRVVE